MLLNISFLLLFFISGSYFFLFSKVPVFVAVASWMRFLPENHSDVRVLSPCTASLPRWFAFWAYGGGFCRCPGLLVCLSLTAAKAD